MNPSYRASPSNTTTGRESDIAFLRRLEESKRTKRAEPQKLLSDRAASTSLLDDCEIYAERGIVSIPMAGKKPVIPWTGRNHPLTPDERESLFSRHGVNGIAVISNSELAVRDFDDIAGFDKWADRNPALAKLLPRYSTGRGKHIWCRSNLPKIVKLDDGEFRGNGLSIAPHSRHRTGHVYQWEVPLMEGPLPLVESSVFIPKAEGNVTESTEGHCSVLSADSVLSVSSPDQQASSVLSVLSVTTPDSIINATLPQREGERNTCILNLARGLKFNSGIKIEETERLLSILRRWHGLALPRISTKSFDVARADFLHAFARAKHPLGINFVDQAASRFDLDALPEVAANYDSIPVRQLIGLCYELSRLNSGRFFISCHDLSTRLNLTPMAVWRLLRMLEDDHVIKAVERGNEHKATRYLWIAPTRGE